MVSSDSLQQHFPWGWLLLTDSESNEDIPSAPNAGPVLVGSTYLLVRVLHEVDGEVAVQVGPSAGDGLAQEFSGPLDVPSGRLRIGDLLDEIGSIVVEVPTLKCDVTVSMDAQTHAERIGITVD